MRLRVTLLLLVFLLVALTLWLGQGDSFSLAGLKRHHRELAALVAVHPLLSRAGFFLVFVTTTGLSLPVATLLTLLAGSLFGFFEAVLLVSFSTSTGATLAMLLSRYVFRNAVERRWPAWVAAINRGLEQDGVFYLVALRLAPAPPYFVVNLLMGLTRMPVARYFIVSQVGMLPIDAMFVNAGRALATLQSPSDILSRDVVLAFVLASLLPLLLRQFVRGHVAAPTE
jgi:uncharacterized membrane protein YdjX (TVP38/TMEM64 family)